MSKKVLGIYGAGGLGREVLELAKIINNKENRWDSFIFVDDDDEIIAKEINGIRVFGYKEAMEKYGSLLEISVGIGEPVIREKIYKKIADEGITLPTLIHPDIYIPDTTAIGYGVTIQYGCFISCNITIKDYVYIQPQCNIGHDVVLDEGCIVSSFGNIAGNVSIGENTYLAMSTTIKEGVRIGNYDIIGMGSVVYKDIPDSMIAMGNPARPMKNNNEKRVFKN